MKNKKPWYLQSLLKDETHDRIAKWGKLLEEKSKDLDKFGKNITKMGLKIMLWVIGIVLCLAFPILWIVLILIVIGKYKQTK